MATQNPIEKQHEKQCAKEIIARIEEMGDERPGLIVAEDIIEIVKEHLGPFLYNQGVADAKKHIIEHRDNLDIELEMLERTPREV